MMHIMISNNNIYGYKQQQKNFIDSAHERLKETNPIIFKKWVDVQVIDSCNIIKFSSSHEAELLIMFLIENENTLFK